MANADVLIKIISIVSPSQNVCLVIQLVRLAMDQEMISV